MKILEKKTLLETIARQDIEAKNKETVILKLLRDNAKLKLKIHHLETRGDTE